jgi:hypothetical protein
MAAPKSPPALARSAVVKLILTRSDAALSCSFAPRIPSSSRATPSRTPCVRSDTLTACSWCGQVVRTMYSETPIAAANDRMARSQRAGVTRGASG